MGRFRGISSAGVNDLRSSHVVVFLLLLLCSPWSHADDGEAVVNSVMELHGKNSIIDYILEKRHGKITIQKKKAFVDVRGRPDSQFVTAKSIHYDLGRAGVDIDDFEGEMNRFVDRQTAKRQKTLDIYTQDDEDDIPLSMKLEYQLKKLRARYKRAEAEYERNKLSREIYSLKKKYEEAKYNEKYHPEKLKKSGTAKRSSTRYYSASCDNYRLKLKNMTSASYRHKVFFCSDRSYREKNPASCRSSGYSRSMSAKSYKSEVNRIRSYIASNCN